MAPTRALARSRPSHRRREEPCYAAIIGNVSLDRATRWHRGSAVLSFRIMMSPEWLGALARYNTWMNGKLYALAAALSDEVRKRDSGAFFKSIHGTFNHLLLA